MHAAAEACVSRGGLAKPLGRMGRLTGRLSGRMGGRISGRSLTTVAAFLCGAAGAIPFALESAPASASAPLGANLLATNLVATQDLARPAETGAASPLRERLTQGAPAERDAAKAIPGWDRNRERSRSAPETTSQPPVEAPSAANDSSRPSAEPALTFNGRPVRAVKTITMRVTAYSPDERSCGDSADNITASGYSVWTNGGRLVAADSRVLPLGSLVAVPGYDGGAVVPVLDRGGAIKGNRLDVLFPSHEQARRWGVRDLKVTVYEYADGEPNDFRERHWVKPGQVAR